MERKNRIRKGEWNRIPGSVSEDEIGRGLLHCFSYMEYGSDSLGFTAFVFPGPSIPSLFTGAFARRYESSSTLRNF